MSIELNYLPAERGFLEADRADAANPQAARAVVIPFGLEASVSYGSGTSAGPRAILEASHQLELFDEEFWCEPCLDYGIATLVPPDIAPMPPGSLEDALGALGRLTGQIAAQGRFPLVLGGEHSLTPGAVAPLAAAFDDLVVLQIDAHADLRDGYLGERYSHASAMRRVLDHDNVSLVSIGIRSISSGEIPFLEANRHRIDMHFAKDQLSWDQLSWDQRSRDQCNQDQCNQDQPGRDQAGWDISKMIAPMKGRNVYVTLDIDGLDSAVMPATGTPEPGGLDFWQVCEILRRTGAVANIVGADVVELAPIKGLHACDFTAAKLAYKIMSYALCETQVR